MLKVSNDWNSLKQLLAVARKQEKSDPVQLLPGLSAKSNDSAKSNHSFLHLKQKDLCKCWVKWQQGRLETVCSDILNFLSASLWRNPWLHQEWPAKAWILLPLQRLNKWKLAESDVFWPIHLFTLCFLQIFCLQTSRILTSGLTVPPTNRWGSPIDHGVGLLFQPRPRWSLFLTERKSGNHPDLNLIENLWTLIKKKVSTLNPTTLDKLKRIIKEIWCKDVDQNACKNFTYSTPSRIQKVIKTRFTTLNTSATAVIWTMLKVHSVCFLFCYVQ